MCLCVIILFLTPTQVHSLLDLHLLPYHTSHQKHWTARVLFNTSRKDKIECARLPHFILNFIDCVFFSWALARICGILSSDWKPIARVEKYHIYSPVDVLVVNIVCTFSCTVDHCIYWCLTCYLTLCSYTEFAGWLRALLYV